MELHEDVLVFDLGGAPLQQVATRPDRALEVMALGHTVDEWEVICLEVSQRLSRKSDQLYRPAMSPEQSRKIREAQEAQEGL